MSSDVIEEKMAGPGIRYWNIALEISKIADVTLMCPNEYREANSNFTVKKITKDSLRRELDIADCIIIQGVTLWNYPEIKKANKPIVVDLYDPFIFENFEFEKEHYNHNELHLSSLTILVDQLLHGDFFICASEKQKDFWIGMLSTLNRINAEEYRVDPTFEKLITVVPFGIPDEPPTHSVNVLKGVHPGINQDDKVVVWGGGLWDWLDPITAIYAMDQIRKKKKGHIKLFFMGVKHPNKDIPMSNMALEAMRLSDSLGLTNRYVFFNDWTEYNLRQNYLLEADIGLSLHKNHIETRFSFRTRILDYIWCNVPVLSNSGDIMSELVERYRIGEVVSSGSSEILADTIIEMIENESKYRGNFGELEEKFRWSKCLQPVVQFCLEPTISKSKNHSLKLRGLYSVWPQRYQKMLKYLLKGNFKIVVQKTWELIKNK